MKFCVSHIDSDQAAVKKEILHEIRQLEKISGSRTGTRKIQREMEALNGKKRKAIDLALEGVISREELKEQNSWYEDPKILTIIIA